MIIGLTGFIGSGKSTVSDIISSTTGCIVDSFAATLKDLTASLFSWDRKLLEGDTKDSRFFRDTVDVWWSEKLNISNFTPRLALQLVGTDLFRNKFNKDIWLYSLQRRYSESNKNIIISDARFTNELRFIKSMGGIIINVSRQAPPDWYDVAQNAILGDPYAIDIMSTTYSHIHRSEWDWVGILPDYTIQNNGTISDLQESVKELINKIF